MVWDGRSFVGLGNVKHGSSLIFELGPGGLTSGHFNDGAAERPDIRESSIFLLFDDFWSHPVSSAFDLIIVVTCVKPF